MKILLVEDEREQQEAFKEAIYVLEHRDGLNVEYKIVKDVSGAMTAIDGSYDGAIVDLKLSDDEIGGNEVVRQLGDAFTRIPIVFVTAFVDFVDNHPSVIKKRRREDGTYESDLLLFKEIYDTGLTRIMGGRGDIEKHLTEVFLKNLLPQRETWVSYGKKDSERTKRALLRYTLNHLLQVLEQEEELSVREDEYNNPEEPRSFPEEVYLYPPLLDKITTGSIVKNDDKWFVVLSPACDLVPRKKKNAKFNTDSILLVEMEREDTTVANVLCGKSGIKERKNRLMLLCTNRYTYYHWLPKTKFLDKEPLNFAGGFLNFRKLQTVEANDFVEAFGSPRIQIAPSFVKDIVARFSSFYARQGQPDIDSREFVARNTAQQKEAK